MLPTNKVDGCLDNFCFVVIPRDGIPDQSFIPDTPENVKEPPFMTKLLHSGTPRRQCFIVISESKDTRTWHRGKDEHVYRTTICSPIFPQNSEF